MFLTLHNEVEIKNWFYDNIGNLNLIDEFEERILLNDTINVLVLSNTGSFNVYVLIKKPGDKFTFIISNDRDRLISSVLNLGNIYYFPTIDTVIETIDNIFKENNEAIPNDNIIYELANRLTPMN